MSATFQVFSGWLRVWLALLLSTLWAGGATAHEINPAVVDLTFGDGEVTAKIDWAIEAPVAGLDLEGLADTNEAAEAGRYDSLRALAPETLAERFREAWPEISQDLGLTIDGTGADFSVTEVAVPEVGNVELARTSTVTLTAPLPPGETAVFRWDPSLGPVVVRDAGTEDGFTAFLSSGGETRAFEVSGAEIQGPLAAFAEYVGVGFDHIVPMGLDHILFVLGLFFLATRLSPLLWQVTAFTLAHTVTLALGALEIVTIPAEIVEPLIAASIVYVGVENVLARRLMPWRPVVVFGFGLLHGLGFASVLQDFGLGASHFVPKLIGFNVGVEIGQLAVIAVAWLAVGALFAGAAWYQRRIAAPVSIAIAVIAVFWVLERTGTVTPDGVWGPVAHVVAGDLPPLEITLWTAGILAVLTAIEMISDSDVLREVAAALTSFLAFMALTAVFTAGAWLLMLGILVAWILALRLQALGGPEAEGAR